MATHWASGAMKEIERRRWKHRDTEVTEEETKRLRRGEELCGHW
jgi:hypothetical protein